MVTTQEQFHSRYSIEQTQLLAAARPFGQGWEDSSGYARERGCCTTCRNVKDCYINKYDLSLYCNEHIEGDLRLMRA
mgnify:CR=1 FL=1